VKDNRFTKTLETAIQMSSESDLEIGTNEIT
jgi:hypothetical protein